MSEMVQTGQFADADAPGAAQAVDPAQASEVAGAAEVIVDITEAALARAPLAAELEAMLIVADEPLPVEELAAAVERTVEDVTGELHRLQAEYREQGRGFDLREVNAAWRFYTSAKCSAIVAAHVIQGQSARLTQAALETLAVVAYRQPVSRARIGAIRGVNVDAVMKTLVTRGLVHEVDTDHETGAILYGTTTHFLERLGISSLDELPELSQYMPDHTDLEEFLDGTGD